MIVGPLLLVPGSTGPVTWNPADKHADITLSGGNLIATQAATNAWRSARATAGKSGGKWYWEVVPTSFLDNLFAGGISTTSFSVEITNFVGGDANSWSYYFDGNKYTSGSPVAYGSTYGLNDVIGVALNMDNGKVWFAKNNVWQASGDPAADTNPAFTGLSGTIYPTISLYRNANAHTGRFKTADFSYSPPSGFSPIGT